VPKSPIGAEVGFKFPQVTSRLQIGLAKFVGSPGTGEVTSDP
jgi:hypothetical protein